MSEKNPLRAALVEPGHMIGIGAVCAASLALLSPIPIAAGLVAEAAYLLFVPSSTWYRSRLDQIDKNARKATLTALRQQVIASVGGKIEARYERLEATRSTIVRGPDNGSGMDGPDLDRKLDLLQQRFLEFALQRHSYSSHLKQVLDQLWSRDIETGRYSGKGPAAATRGSTADIAVQIRTILSHDVETVGKEMATAKEDGEKEILMQRQAVIERRMDQLNKIARTVSSIDTQMALLEDTFGLIGDETHSQSPETIVSDVEEAVARSDALTQTIAELRPLQMGLQ